VVNRGVSDSAAFDSNLSGTRDVDLEATSGGNGLWSGGNLAGTNLGGLLIIQENDAGCDDGVCNHPDDEGSRPAGSLTFEFTLPILEFGLDLVDVEGADEAMGALVFLGSQGEAAISFESLLDASLFGDNTANRIDPLEIAGLGIGDVSTLRVELGGSGGLDNIRFTPVPEPTTAALFALGLLGLVWRGAIRS